MSNYDHIVVGGGVAGMTCAILLAQAGGKVVLLESFRKLAPTIRGFRRNGVYFDTGLHTVGGLGDGHPLDIYFNHLGIADHIERIPFNENGYDTFIDEMNNQTFPMACGFSLFAEQLKTWFPAETTAIDTYLNTIQKVMSESPFLNFDIDFDLKQAFHADFSSLRDFLDNLTDNEQLKTILSYQSILYGVPPEDGLFTTHAQVAGSYLLSAHTVKGGGEALAKAFEKRLVALGVEVRSSVPVEAVLIQDKQITGVRLQNGEAVTAPSCVWTAHPSSLIKATPDSAFRPAFRKRIESLKDTASALMLFGISETPLPELESTCLISWKGAPLSESIKGNLPAEDTILYLTSAYDDAMGKTALTAIMSQNVDSYAQWAESTRSNRSESYKQHKRDLLTKLELEIYRRLPSLKGKVNFVDGATPLTLKEYCSTPTGSLYGVRHETSQFNPAPVTKVHGLTLAGQSIVAPGILGAVISAYLTCGIITGHDAIHGQLRTIARERQ